MTLHFYVGTSAGFTSGTDLGNTSVRLADLPGFTEAADGGNVSFSGLPFDDPTDSLGLIGLRPFWVEETAASPTRLWTGYITDRTYSRNPGRSQLLGAANVTEPNLVDLNAIAAIRVIAFLDGRRPAEPVTARLAWILGTTYLPVYDNGQVAASTGVTMDATSYTGQYPVDVLNDCAAASDRNWFIYWDSTAPAGQEISLYFHHLGFTTGFTSSIRLSNKPSDIDNVTTFAASGSLNRDPSQTYSGVWMPYDGGHVWVTRASTASAFISRHAVAPALKTKSRTKAANRAETFLDNADHEQDVITASCLLPVSKVNSALIGRSIDVHFDHLTDYATGYTSLQISRRTVTQTPDPNYFQVDFELSNPKVFGGGGGSEVVDPKPFVPDCVTGTGADTSSSLLTGKTITAGGSTPPANPGNVNDGDVTTTSNVSAGIGGPETATWTVDLGAATSVGGWGYYITSACNVPIYLQASTDNFAGSIVDIVNTGGDESGGLNQVTFTAVSYRYWRQKWTSTSGGYHCGVINREWELYATDDDCNEPQVGQPIPPETPGSTTDAILCYVTNYPYLPGSLHVTVNGLPVIVDETNPDTGGWCLTQHYPPGAVINVSYQAASPTGTGAGNPDAAPVNTPALPVPSALGDMIAADGTLWRRLAVGSNGSILMADSTSGVGVKWATSSNFSGGGSGVSAITANGSNSLTGTVNLKAGVGIALGVSGQDITVTNTGSSGGGSGSTDAILGQSGQGGARISGLQADPSIDVAGTNDDEFNTTDTSDPITGGWTSFNSPDGLNANSTAKSHLYIKKNANATVQVTGVVKAIPSMPFTVTTKLTGHTMGRHDYVRVGGLFVCASNSSSPGKILAVHVNHDSGKTGRWSCSAVIYTNPTTFSSIDGEITDLDGLMHLPLYYRLLVTSSTDISSYVSTDGVIWTLVKASTNPSFTVAGVGLMVDPEQANYNVEGVYDWIRFT